MKDPHKIDFRFAPPSGWTCLALQDDPHKTVVREDGALMYGFDRSNFSSWKFNRVFEFSLMAAYSPQSIAQVTETPRFPSVVTTIKYARADLELRAFAHFGSGKRTDIVLWRIDAHPGAGEVLTGLKIDAIELMNVFMARSGLPGRVIFSVKADNQPDNDFKFSDDQQITFEEDESQPGPGVPAFVSTEPLVLCHPSGFRPSSALSTELCVLQGGESIQGALIFPQNYTDMTHLNLDWANQAYLESRQYWQDLPTMRLPIQVPDPDLMAMLEACARNILQAREIEHGLPVFKVGPTVYRDLFVVDGHFLLEAATFLGLKDDAYRGVDTLLRRVHPDGSISEMPFHSKETGISIFTLIRQCELMDDDERLRSLWPVIQNGVAFIESLRKIAANLPTDDPCHGLMPSAYADGGIGGKRGEYTTVVWTLAGLKAASETALRLEINEDATRFKADFDSLMSDFRKHAAKDQKQLPDGTTYLPMNKPGTSDHNWIPNYPYKTPIQQKLTPASATWAFCQSIHPGEVFSPDDPLVQDLLRLYELYDDEEGIPAFTGWLPYKSIWSYNAGFAANAWLYAGRGDKAIDYLYAFANHAYPTRVWREEQSLKSTQHGQLFGDMPHNWASAEFIRLVRHLAVFEANGGLHLLSGIPNTWRSPKNELLFEKTPTRYGPITLRLQTEENYQFVLSVNRDPSWKRQPEFIRVHLNATHIRVQGKPAQTAFGQLDLPLDSSLLVEGIWA